MLGSLGQSQGRGQGAAPRLAPAGRTGTQGPPLPSPRPEGRALLRVLTPEDLPLLADVPRVEGGSLLRLHGGALVEVLGEVRLVEAGDVHHLPLRDVVLLHVPLDHLRRPPRVLAVGREAKG